MSSPAATAATIATLSSWKSRTTMNTTAGTPESMRPFQPPKSWTKCLTERSCSGADSATDRPQLVGRVVDRDLAVVLGEAAAGHQRATGVDPPDPASTEPDERDGAGAVVQL